MSDDLELTKENEQVTDADLEEVEIEYTTRAEYIQCAYFAISAVVDMDTGLMNGEEKKRVKRIVRKSLMIIDDCITEMFDELYDDDDDD